MSETTRPYVGFSRVTGSPVAFRSAAGPTNDSHGVAYFACMGPFRTMRAARFTAGTHPNPHVQTVADAERISARLAKS